MKTLPKALAIALAPLLLASGGGPLALADLSGAPVELRLGPAEDAVVVHFWATWCRECVAELPALASAAELCAGDAVRVLAVNVGDSAEAIAAWRAEHAFDLPVLRDAKGDVFRRFARGLPANLIWTPRERRTDTGMRDVAAWRTTLSDLGCR